MKSIHLFLLLLAVLILPLNAFAAEEGLPQAITVNKIAAVVNGEIVTLHELRQHSMADLKRSGLNPADQSNRRHIENIMSRVLSVMIDDILLRQEAERLQIKVTDQEVDNELNMLAKRNQVTLQEFDARVTAQGGSIALMKDRIRRSILSQRIIGLMIARKTVITSEEISDYFEAHKNDFQAEKSVNVSLIIFSPSSNSVETAKRITAGSLSFEEAAKKFSEGPAAEIGGNLGMIQWDDLAAPIKAQVVNLSKGNVSEIFQINGRDCLLKLNDATSGRNMTKEEAAPEIERILREPRLQQRFTEYTQELRSRAVIDIRM